jgi:predicted LPLAT superfamily acyltransferase
LTGRKAGRGSPVEWESRAERGSSAALQFLVWCIRRIGYHPLQLLLSPIAAYYCLFAPEARRASLDYLRRIAEIQGQPQRPRLRDVYQHLLCFASVILDRLSLWSGDVAEFKISVHGEEHMEALVESESGALLVGAHIGSFDMLRVIAREAGVPVTVVMNTTNAAQINRAFKMLDPETNVRVIDFNPTSVSASFEIRQCIARGEFVAILGDRVRSGVKRRVVHADFLGARAAFPQGPLLLPMVLGVPVLLTIAIRTGPRAYDVYLERLADGTPVPLRQRREIVQQRIEHFAARLEHYCLLAPHQWFNFYDFWADFDDAQE